MTEALYEEYLKIKAYEEKAAARKLEIEKELLRIHEIEATEGSKTFKDGNYKVCVTGKLNKTVNAEALKALPAEFPEITRELLGTVFKWKPDIIAAEWKKLDEEVQEVLSRAITVTPAKISFKITKEEE